jgi:hypothetical protein
VLQKIVTLDARHCFETPAFTGPFFTVNKMRTLSQPQQIKGNVWDVSTKDFVCFKPGEVTLADVGAQQPSLEKLEKLSLFAGGKSFKFKNAIVGPTPKNDYMDQAALMPNVQNPSDHMMVISILPLKVGEKSNEVAPVRSAEPAAIEG